MDFFVLRLDKEIQKFAPNFRSGKHEVVLRTRYLAEMEWGKRRSISF
jgi:hypothetical protein